MAREACETILGSHDHKDSLFSTLDYLELIAKHAKGFSFKKITSDGNTGGSTKALLGILWMTATTRQNFDLYGGYICLGMMMRAITTLNWPCTSVALQDEYGQLCLALEGFSCGETLDMYAAKKK